MPIPAKLNLARGELLCQRRENLRLRKLLKQNAELPKEKQHVKLLLRKQQQSVKLQRERLQKQKKK